MITVNVKHELDVLRDFYPTRGLEEAKRRALQDAKRVLEREQKANRFPTDESQYLLYLRTRGSESRRDFGKIDPRHLRIPFTLEWVSTSGSTAELKKATIFALQQLRQRAPVDTGTYSASISIWLNGVPVTIGQFLAREITAEDLVFVAPNVPYATPIEYGFYKGRYKTRKLPGGVVRPIAKAVRSRFPGVAARFTYINPTTSTHRQGTLPVIELGLREQFVGNDARPGTQARRNARRRAGQRAG